MLTAGHGKNYCTILLEAGTPNTALSTVAVQTHELRGLPTGLWAMVAAKARPVAFEGVELRVSRIRSIIKCFWAMIYKHDPGILLSHASCTRVWLQNGLYITIYAPLHLGLP